MLIVRKLVPTLAVAALALLLLVGAGLACSSGGGGSDGGDNSDEGSPAATPADEDGGGDGGDVSFPVSMTDNLFGPNEFTVAAGSTATFELANDGVAIHNMRVAGADNAYGTDDDAVSDPELVSAGAAAVVVWEAPAETGVYDFRCDFHPTDMLGTITVE
jgi:plastocyanin